LTFTIAHLSDAHLSPAPFPHWKEMRLKRFMGYINWRRERVRLNDMGALARLVADMLGHKPDHIAMTGDVVNIALPIEFKRAVEWMKIFGDPNDVSFTPGNHDAYVRDAMEGLARSFQPWTRGDGVAPGAEKFPYLRVRKNIAIIGLNSGVPTAPLLASGKLGEAQLAQLPLLLDSAREKGLARVVLIHHPPHGAAGRPLLRGLNDAREFERIVEAHGAEAILHGHTHKRLLNFLPSHATHHASGRVPVFGAPSCSSTSRDPRQRAAYFLIRFERAGDVWRTHARARGLLAAGEIGEQEPLAL
jgi:3',5'-cyclic AMP phosphodiesterase CpdA